MAQQPMKQKQRPASGAKRPVQKAGLNSTVNEVLVALKVYFGKANGYEVIAMALFACVLMVLVFARPDTSRLPTALRLLALVTTMAAKFLSNSGLSANQGSQTDQAVAKRLSLLLDGVAATMAAISFFV